MKELVKKTNQSDYIHGVGEKKGISELGLLTPPIRVVCFFDSPNMPSWDSEVSFAEVDGCDAITSPEHMGPFLHWGQKNTTLLG